MHHGLLNLIEMKKMKKIPKSSGVRNKIVIQELKSLEKTYTNIVDDSPSGSTEGVYATNLLWCIYGILEHYGEKEYTKEYNND